MAGTTRISCLCGMVNEHVRLKSEPPIPVTVCHCNTCRHTSGSLYNSYLPIYSPLGCVESLKAYSPFDSITRYFCPQCGCHVCQQSRSEWMISSGVIGMQDGSPFDTLENIIAHEFVEDTLDGGLSTFLSDGTNIHPKRSTDTSSRTKPNNPSTSADVAPSTMGETKLQASCHCGGVKFYLTAPNESSRAFSSPWPDLIVPYHKESPVNPEDVKWWIRNNKWMAGTCACRTCRLGLGFPIQAWAFVSKSNIFQPNGSQFDFDTGTLKAFESSPGVYREFCGICGATAFWHCTERPNVIDVNVGILNANEGARAEKWLEWWTQRVSFSEMAVDRKLIDSLEQGLRNYHVASD